MKVVFDSNIYVSALALPGGFADRAMEAAIKGAIELHLSRPILEEVLGVLSRKFARDAEEISRIAILLASIATIVSPERRIRVLADLPDNRVLECAAAAGAELIVTGDRGILSLGAWEGIAIVPLREFVERLDRGREVRQPRAPYAARVDIVPFNRMRAGLAKLAAEARAGAEKIITRNGDEYVALVDARRLDHHHRLERQHIHDALLHEALKGMEDVRGGRVATARQVLAKYR